MRNARFLSNETAAQWEVPEFLNRVSILLKGVEGDDRHLVEEESTAHRREEMEMKKMADPEDKVDGQAPGKYYVDTNCIDCDVCRETAPANFAANEDEGFSFVVKQPENDEEEALCQEAMEGCPVEAIGDDGADA